MSAPLSTPRCVCQATSAVAPTGAEHEVWCPSRKPSDERIAEIKAGGGPVMLAGELEWLAGDASRAELHVSGAAAGAFPLSDDLPGWVAELGRKLGAVVAELDRTRSALAQSEHELTGARLALWEEEQDHRRTRAAFGSARKRAAQMRARVAELEGAPLAWAEKLDAKSLDNLLITLSQAADHEPVSGAIAEIHEVLASFRQAVEGKAEEVPAQPPEGEQAAADSPAARLAQVLIRYDDAAAAQPVDATTLELTVEPADLDRWQWWLDLVAAPVGQATFQGSYATAKGSIGRATVLLTGVGVGALYAAERDRVGGESS